MRGGSLPIFAAIVLLLSGCAFKGGAAPEAYTVAEITLQGCMRATGARELLAVEVPATGYGLANWLATAALQAGPSSTAETLTRLLTAQRRPVLVVHGEDPGLNVATLQTALQSLPTNSAVVQLPVCVAGLNGSHTTLLATAQDVGIPLVALPQP